MVLTVMQGASTLMLPITASKRRTNLQSRYSICSLLFFFFFIFFSFEAFINLFVRSKTKRP